MSTGGGSSGKGAVSGLDTNLQQGQFEFGPSQYDTNAIMTAIGGNTQGIQNTYSQLGMGGSTPEQEDLTNQTNLGQAAIGQAQTQDVGNAAFNPALQTAQTNIPTSSVLQANQLNEQIGAQEGGAIGGGLGTLASLGAKAL